jgi:hypothetical protein
MGRRNKSGDDKMGITFSPACRDESLFAIRYSLFAIRYSLFAIRYSLFAIPSSALLVLVEWVLPATQAEADGNAGKIKVLAQRVHQVALVAFRHFCHLVSENRKGRRP